jgi:hypothetical protein
MATLLLDEMMPQGGPLPMTTSLPLEEGLCRRPFADDGAAV